MHIAVGEICSLQNRSRCHKFVDWLCYLNFFDPTHCETWICCFRTWFSLEVDFPALKFHRVLEFSKIHFRGWRTRVIHHTTVIISSTNMITDSTSSLEVWCRYWRILLFPFHFLFPYHCISCNVRSQSARRWCQILWIFGESWGWSFSSSFFSCVLGIRSSFFLCIVV